MVMSQNGWPAYADTNRFVRATARGFGFWAANRDVAEVFIEFINRFDQEIEEITGPMLDDWSYANRLVRGSTSVVSNHGSATAIDLNALKHSRGKRNTFTTVQQQRIRRIRDSIVDAAGRPVLRLGMDFTTTPDDMHIEIVASPARVREAADIIRARNALALEDIMASKEELEALLIDLLTSKRLVENLPLDAGTPQGRNWTLAELFAADDRKLDLIRREQAAQAATLTAQAAAIGSLSANVAQKATIASVAALSAKIDELIRLLTPPAP